MQESPIKNKTDRTNSTRKIIRFEDGLLEQINELVGEGNFSSWVKDACREKLRNAGIKPKA
ncbi:YlcI/YnfO family protein [Enterobacter chuandaensis]|uniref:YlcI/YnfO family protein n=1 Tax=Enterobacter chuandaensis TaxID=2497875 RepID=UPI003216EBCA